MSAGVESSTKSGRVRRVPLADQAATALDRMSRREHFTSPDDLVFCNVLGRALDDSALRRRYRRAQAAVDVRPLRSTTCVTRSARCLPCAGSMS